MAHHTLWDVTCMYNYMQRIIIEHTFLMTSVFYTYNFARIIKYDLLTQRVELSWSMYCVQWLAQRRACNNVTNLLWYMYADLSMQCKTPATSLGTCCTCSTLNWSACLVHTGYVFFGTLVLLVNCVLDCVCVCMCVCVCVCACVCLCVCVPPWQYLVPWSTTIYCFFCILPSSVHCSAFHFLKACLISC